MHVIRRNENHSFTESRGHLPYLAPELFAADGIFSFATDFWALGCLLHELRRGFAPFGGVATDTSVLADRYLICVWSSYVEFLVFSSTS